ncbi:NAD(P)H-hydrate dehydratase [Algivirga pacifica]|uniref:Bifunctional NAD(P)H-hydrate repair enzyme n=1 Tax=Algivirga pacifica TaxID=1162670 RepID=A0ABP9D6J2_9BACT
MMLLLSAEQIRAWDAYTIAQEPIASVDLMERAASCFVDWFTLRFYPDQQRPIYIICGPGNNGGDGLVVSRLLLERGYQVFTYAVLFTPKKSEDFKVNEERLSKLKPLITITEEEDFPEIPSQGIVIDALLGTGINRPASGLCLSAVQWINDSQSTEVIAMDMPSGLFTDQALPEEAIAVRADYTVSFQAQKVAFMFAENAPYTGEVSILNIGLHPNYLEQVHTTYTYVTPDHIAPMYRRRKQYSHKGTYGHIMLVGGSKGKIGAIVLSSKASLRAGVGLLTSYVPYCGYNIFQTAVPEAMCITDPDFDCITEVPVVLNKFSSIGMGPGMGTQKESQEALKDFLTLYDNPMVLDADALNMMGKDPELLDKIPENSILTPHPKEFERLLGDKEYSNQFERLELQLAFSKRYNVIVVLKGAHTCITTPLGTVFFNSTGNPGMATAGSGDVLTGIITGLLGQGYAPVEAAVLGVYIHGLSADLAVEEVGVQAMIASDVVSYLGKAWKTIETYTFI